MKTAISIPDDVFEAAEQMARRLQISRSELFVRAMTRYLTTKRGDDITARLDAVYSEEDSHVDEAIAAMQHESIFKDEW